MRFELNKNIVTPTTAFNSWFDTTYYHALYQNRNDEEAQGFIDNLLDELQPTSRAHMLDLGCGSGRHSRYLAAKGFSVHGIDLAANSIRDANRYCTESLTFDKHDMRRPFGDNRYDVVFNFFTSFGYFKHTEENDAVVSNMAASMKDGAELVIDYLNAEVAIDNLVPVEEKEIDGIWYKINRWCDERFIYKRIAVTDQRLLRGNVFVEQVARFTVDDFDRMLSRNGLQLTNVFGDYSLSTFDSKRSPRMILLAKKIKVC
ncbi:MAG: methyltransferase domain-containing protein [Chitinophagaceae bacterium]|nr:methyltransferase domain-containing protein [Chitinophagaceae bacterium]